MVLTDRSALNFAAVKSIIMRIKFLFLLSLNIFNLSLVTCEEKVSRHIFFFFKVINLLILLHWALVVPHGTFQAGCF